VRIAECGLKEDFLIADCPPRRVNFVRRWIDDGGSLFVIADCGAQSVDWKYMTTQELKERTFEFGVRVIDSVESLPKSEIGTILGRQLLRAGTSVGANYRAAARARSRADFISKLGIVEEECDEALYWMEMIVARKLLKEARLSSLLKEGSELLAIIVASIKTARRH
jgi:four helix bundle protein